MVSNVATTYSVFSYVCGDIQWSSVGTNRSAVVGFNSEGNEFGNHPLSGFSDIGDAVSCTAQVGKRRKRQRETTNDKMKLPTNETLQNLIKRCVVADMLDKILLLGENTTELAQQLEPCPFTRDQALVDYGRFVEQENLSQCFVSTNPVEVQVLLTTISLTQQCCYDGMGRVILLNIIIISEFS